MKLTAREVRHFSTQEVAPQLEALVFEQWKETGQYRSEAGHVKYQPDFASIFSHNDRGLYRVICLFHGPYEIVGYLFFFVMPSFHTSRIVATHDIFFVRKDWRFGKGALLLLHEADRVCEGLGVREVYAGHYGGESMTKLMIHCGYKVIGAQCYKALGGLEV